MMGLLAAERRLVSNAKKMFLLASGVAVQRHRDKMADQQEVLSLLSDLVIGVYAMESLLLRVLKGAARDGVDRWELQVKATQVFVHSQLATLEDKAKQILAAASEGDELRTHLAALRRFRKINAAEFDQLEAGHRAKTQRGREVLLELRARSLPQTGFFQFQGYIRVRLRALRELPTRSMSASLARKSAISFWYSSSDLIGCRLISRITSPTTSPHPLRG
jgi:hypothetical protein